MKKLIRFTFSLTFGLLSSAAAIGQAPQSSHLTRANNTFRVADADKDGSLEPAELSRASISATTVRTWDKDSSGSLSKDEFLLYYRSLLVNTRRAPGADFDREAARIAKLHAEQAKKRAEAARKQGSAGTSTRESSSAPISTAEKYRRAQAALNERIKKLAGRTAETRAAQEELAQRARGVGGRAAQDPDPAKAAPQASETGPTQGIRLRLKQAQDTLQRRAQAAGASREQFGRANDQLQKRATESHTSDSREEPSTIADKLKQAKESVTDKAVQAGARRERVINTQDSLTNRARKAAGSSEETQITDPELAGVPASERQKLNKSLEALKARARSGGWTDEQFSNEKRRMIKRAQDVHAKTEAGENSSPPASSSEARQPSTERQEDGGAEGRGRIESARQKSTKDVRAGGESGPPKAKREKAEGVDAAGSEAAKGARGRDKPSPAEKPDSKKGKGDRPQPETEKPPGPEQTRGA